MTSIVRGNEKSGSVRRNILNLRKWQRHWHLRDLSPGYRNLSGALRVVIPIEIESVSVGSGNIHDGAAVVSDLGILGDSQRRQRAAKVPDCDGEAHDEKDGAGQRPLDRKSVGYGRRADRA